MKSLNTSGFDFVENGIDQLFSQIKVGQNESPARAVSDLCVVDQSLPTASEMLASHDVALINLFIRQTRIGPIAEAKI